jgi:hypothetical protein
MTFGKKLADATYYHKSAEMFLPKELQVLINKAKKIAQVPYTVIKISNDKSKISFLVYKNFFKIDHPELSVSYSINLLKKEVKEIHYSKENPPILHRKECFLHFSHKKFNEFKQLSDKEEKLGLLSKNNIGYKQQWLKLLKSMELNLN